MRLPTRRPPRRALTASASRYTRTEQNLSAEHWQTRALKSYDQIGELHFSAQFLARMMSRVRFFPARISSGGQLEEITSGPAFDAMQVVQDPGGGRARVQYDYGRLMMVTGEGALFFSGSGVRFLWRDEIKVSDDGTTVRLDRQQKPVEPGTAYRLWTPHPRHSEEADSPVRSVLDICEELLVLTSSVRSTATTRKTAGILAFAQDFSPDPLLTGQDEDPEANPMLSDMIEHLKAQIEKPGTAEASMPYLWEVPLAPGERLSDRIQWIRLHDPATDFMERDLRIEAIRRLALSMDMPPEALLGMTDANHWTAQQVMHDMWRSFGIDKAQQFARDLNQVYLRPLMLAAGEPVMEIVLGLDDSQVFISPDRTTIANDALDRVAIDREGYRKLAGIPDEFKPDPEEEALLVGLRTRNPQLVGLDLGQRGPIAEPQQAANPSNGPPAPTNGRPGSRQEAQTAAIVGAAQMALRQARAKAGARLRSHQHSCEECRERTKETPASLVAAVLGQEQVSSFGLDPRRLVAGGTSEFRGILDEWGFDTTGCDTLCARLEAWAAHTLFLQSVELPPGFAAQVEEARSYAVGH